MSVSFTSLATQESAGSLGWLRRWLRSIHEFEKAQLALRRPRKLRLLRPTSECASKFIKSPSPELFLRGFAFDSRFRPDQWPDYEVVFRRSYYTTSPIARTPKTKAGYRKSISAHTAPPPAAAGKKPSLQAKITKILPSVIGLLVNGFLPCRPPAYPLAPSHLAVNNSTYYRPTPAQHTLLNSPFLPVGFKPLE